MRNITIKREKKFVACLNKMQVFMEVKEQAEAELLIAGIPCKKIGVLKNGGEITFEAPEEETKLIVIGDKLSKEFCNEIYLLEAGNEDVTLTGRNKYDPVSGNPFRIDGNSSEVSTAQRKKSKAIAWAIIGVAALVGFIIGLTSGLSDNKKSFTYEELRITLTDEFKGYTNEDDSCDVFCESDDLTVAIERTAIDSSNSELTAKEFAEANYKDINGVSFEVFEENKYAYFGYDTLNDDDQPIYSGIACIYKSEDAFWLVDFFSDADSFQDQINTVFEYADSVKFK